MERLPINKVVQNGQALIDTAAAAVTAANRESDRLHSAADGVAGRIASQPVKPAAIPALPPQARQLPAPSWCFPTCSSALISERATWLDLLTKAVPAE